jgi:hypothetical protein
MGLPGRMRGNGMAGFEQDGFFDDEKKVPYGAEKSSAFSQFLRVLAAQPS